MRVSDVDIFLRIQIDPCLPDDQWIEAARARAEEEVAREVEATDGEDVQRQAVENVVRWLCDSRHQEKRDQKRRHAGESEATAWVPPEFDVEGEPIHGGMGMVVQARQAALGRSVALKCLRPRGDRCVLTREEVASLIDEAQKAAVLKHPNIVTIHSVYDKRTPPVIVMEWMGGGTLDDRLQKEGPWNSGDAAELVAQLAEAVHLAHSFDIVHRDLKPKNVLFDEHTGTPKIADFGIAARLSDSGEPVSDQGSGTLLYKAPEQVTRGTIDARTDVHGLGLILFECLTGKNPFRADSPEAIRQKVLSLTPELPDDLPRNAARREDLAAICGRCLKKDPDSRYQTAKELADDLRKYQRGQETSARSWRLDEHLLGWATHHPWTAGAAGFAIVSIIAALVVSWILVPRFRHQAVVNANLARAVTEAQQEQALAQVGALTAAAPAGVPSILASLDLKRVRSRLEELLGPGRSGLDEAQRSRVRLALLRVDHAQLPLLATRLPESDIAELLVIRDELWKMRDELSDFDAELVELMWRILEDDAEDLQRRFRAAAVLAKCDVNDERWSRDKFRLLIVKQLLEADPLFLNDWMQAFRGIGAVLFDPLEKTFGKSNQPIEKRTAAIILADYAGDDPERLSRLLIRGDAAQFDVLFQLIQRDRERAAAVFREELKRDITCGPSDAGVVAPNVQPWLVDKLEAAHGMLEPQFALVQTMPMTEAVLLAEDLDWWGYRPVRFRPYATANGVQVAAVWIRDHQRWCMSVDQTLESIFGQQEEREGTGWIPVDLAGYVTKEGAKPSSRYVTVWASSTANPPPTAILRPGIADDALNDELDKLRSEDLFPSTMQHFVDPGGVLRVNMIASSLPDSRYWGRNLTQAEYEGMLTPSRGQADVGLSAAAAPAPDRDYWQGRVLDEADKLAEIAPNDHWVFFWRAQAHLKLREYDKSIEAATGLCEHRRRSAYRFLAEAHARRGDESEARKYLGEYRILEDKEGDEILLAARVGAHFGDHAALADLDRILNPSDCPPKTLRQAAGIYAIACGQAAEHDAELADTYAQKAMSALRRCIGDEKGDLEVLREDDDLKPLGARSEYCRLLRDAGFTPRYCYLSRSNPAFLTAELHGMQPSEHLARCRELAASGYLPSAIAACSVAGAPPLVTASVWRQSVPSESQKDEAARRQANAALGLLRLGYSDEVWPLFQHKPDPRLRSFLLARLRPLNIPPELLAARLAEEKDASIRRGLVLGLGEFKLDQIPSGMRATLIDCLATLYRDDADPGVHGAAEWLLRSWDHFEGSAAKIDRDPSSDDRGQRDWCVDGQGHDMVIIHGPVEFDMGSLPQDLDRFPDELQHRRRITRSFAIAAKPTTVAQYLEYFRTYQYTRSKSPTSDCPINSVSWYDAARYCRWLSEKEDVPEHEMCYPQVSAIKPGMRLPDDFLSRTGYRLPTEAEFEFACRAGAVTPRFYGNSLELLPRYARYGDNARGRTWPSAELRPNDFGLFDVLGNVRQWCHDVYAEYANLPAGGRQEDVARSDLEDPEPSHLDTGKTRCYRNGDFTSTAVYLRSARRFEMDPRRDYNQFGFRVARTHYDDGAIAALTKALEAEHGDWRRRLERARAFEATRQWEKSDDDYVVALRDAPSEAKAGIWFRRARIAAQKSRWGDAIERYSIAHQLAPHAWQYLKGRADAYTADEQWDEALEDLRKCRHLSPDNPELLVSQRNVLIKLEKWDECLEIQNRILDIGYFTRPSSLAQRGEYHHRAGQFQSALDDFTEAIEFGYDRSWVFKWRALTHVELKILPAALADYSEAIDRDPEDADSFGRRGDVYFGLQQWDDALEDYTRATKLDVGNADYWNSRGVCSFGLTRWEDAITGFSEAVRLAPKSWLYTRNRGNARAQSGDFANAAEDYKQAVQLGCQHPQSWMEHALIQHKVTGPDAYVRECKEMFAQFAETDAPVVASQVLRCYALLPGIVAGDDAISAFERVLSDSENRAEYWFTIGAVRYRQQRFSEAAASLEKAVDAAADGGEALSWLFLAMTQLRLGDADQGKEWLDKGEMEIDRILAQPLSGGAADRRPDWAMRLELTLVRQEARGLFGAAATGNR